MSEFEISRVQEFAGPLAESLGLALLEIQFRREGHGWVLRLIIDCDEGVNVDHCARMSREVSDYLDVEDFIEHKYHLEVSSPGLERTLYNVNDFVRFLEKKARVKLKEQLDGQRVFVGEIKRVENDSITLKTEDGQTVSFSFEQIKKARLTIE